jgi:hypothetical protein
MTDAFTALAWWGMLRRVPDTEPFLSPAQPLSGFPNIVVRGLSNIGYDCGNKAVGRHDDSGSKYIPSIMVTGEPQPYKGPAVLRFVTTSLVQPVLEQGTLSSMARNVYCTALTPNMQSPEYTSTVFDLPSPFRTGPSFHP